MRRLLILLLHAARFDIGRTEEIRTLTGPDTTTASRQGPAAIAAGHTDPSADGDVYQRAQDMFQAELC
jgi:hypothetical protein